MPPPLAPTGNILSELLAVLARHFQATEFYTPVERHHFREL